MKNLIFIGGAMGVGKSTIGKILKNELDRCVYLDGDWCCNSSPFVVTDETKALMLDNISYLLCNYFDCSEFDNIILTWVMHEQGIIDELISRLGKRSYHFYNYSLVCSSDILISRLEKDINQGVRTADEIDRSIPRLLLYDKVNSIKINTDNLKPIEVARLIINEVNL